MKKLACIYFTDSENQIALFEFINNELVLKKTGVFSAKKASFATSANQGMGLDGEFSFDEGEGGDMMGADEMNDLGLSFDEGEEENDSDDTVSSQSEKYTYLQKLSNVFEGDNIKDYVVIPIIREEAVSYQKMKEDAGKKKNGKVSKFPNTITISDNSKLEIHAAGQHNFLDILHEFSNFNSIKSLDIPTVKVDVFSLAGLISNRYLFEDSEYTMVIHIGSIYSNVFFMKGRSIYRISQTITIGKETMFDPDVFLSKIMMEAQNSKIKKISNIILSGEPPSKGLLQSIDNSVPNSLVTTIDVAYVKYSPEVVEKPKMISSFSVPISVAQEYYREKQKLEVGINLLPQYKKKKPKPISIGLIGLLTLPLMFAAGYFLTQKINENILELREISDEIRLLENQRQQSEELLNQIAYYENRVNNFGQTQALLDSATVGAAVVNRELYKLGTFTQRRKNLWLKQLNYSKDGNLVLSGYSFSRSTLTELTDSYTDANLRNIIFEELEDRDVYTFELEIRPNLLPEKNNE